MLHRLRPRLTYANVVSTLCLFLLLGGVGYAATALPRNSVGTKQLKRNAVTSSKIKRGAVRTDDVKNGTLRAEDFDEDDLPQGPRGAQGPRGPRGAPGSDATVDGVPAGGDLSGTYPGPQIRAGRVGTAELGAGAVRGPDADASGAAQRNFDPMAPGNCTFFSIPATAADGDLEDDAIVVTPSPAFSGSFTVTAEAEGAALFQLKVCNVGREAEPPSDPDGPGGTTYRFVAFDVG